MGNYICKKCGNYRDHLIVKLSPTNSFNICHQYNSTYSTLFGCKHEYSWVELTQDFNQSLDWKEKIDNKIVTSTYNLNGKKYNSVSIHKIQQWWIKTLFLKKLIKNAYGIIAELWWHPDYKGGWFIIKNLKKLELDLKNLDKNDLSYEI